MVDIARLEIQADSRQISSASSSLDNLTESAGKADKSVAGVGSAFRSIAPYIKAVTSALGVRQLVRYSDEWSDLNSRLINATKSVEGADFALARISETARRTYSSLRETAQGFLQNNLVLTELGYSTERQLDMMAALNNSLVVSGAKGDQASLVMNAFGRAMAQGSLKGQELNLIMNYSSRTVEALAAGLGVTTIQLRQMTAAGEITADRMFGALISQMEKLAAEADAMPATIGDGLLLINNSLLEFIGRMDQASGVGDRIAAWLISVADYVDNLSAALASGQVGHYLEAIGHSFAEMGRDIEHVMTLATEIIKTNLEAWGQSADNFLRDAFLDMPGNLRDMFNIAALEIQIFARRVRAYGENIAGYLDPRSWFSSERQELLRAQLETDLAIIEQDWFMRMDELASRREDRQGKIAQSLADAQTVRAEWERTRQVVDSAMGGNMGGNMVGGPETGMTEKEIEAINRRVEAIRQANLTEVEMQQERYAREIEALNLAFANELLTREEWHAQIELSYARHTDALTDINKKGWNDRQKYEAMTMKQRAAFLAGEMAGIVGVFASHNDTMFSISKIFSAGSAFVATLAGQAEALKLGWPMGPIAAMKIGATGFGFVSAIKQAKKGGGASIGSAAASDLSAAAVPTAPAQGQQTFVRNDPVVQNVTFQFLDAREAEAFFERHRGDIRTIAVEGVNDEYNSRGMAGPIG